MRRQLLLLVCAVQFLTRLPTPTLANYQADWIARSARYFPLVGQLVGALGALVLVGASTLWGGWVPALLAIATCVLLTGGFHEDGLADSADGLIGGLDRPSRLLIMKDSRIGTYGVMALGLVTALKAATLAGIEPLPAALAMVAAHGGGRAAAVVGMRILPYAGDLETAKWRRTAEAPRNGEVLLALLFSLWPLALMPTGGAAAGLVVGAAFAFAPALAGRRLVGGQTGDILGAVEQLFELGFLLGAAAVASQGATVWRP
jgi:adenosylcobinamide-GDP ribazoletransferase